MRAITIILVFGILTFVLMYSCESDENTAGSEFKLVFSDGSEISEREIQYYDTASHLLFLKRDIQIEKSITGYSLLVNNDTIYKGIIHFCIMSSPPRSAFYISDCFHYGHNIIELGYYPYLPDLRNDSRIVSALKKRGLLRNGITCRIDTIGVMGFEDHSEVFCKITLTNNDDSGYYIPDPVKMGELDFNYYTGGLSFYNTVTKVSSFLRWSVSNPDFGSIGLNDLSFLKGNSNVSFTFESPDYYKMDKGNYKVNFRFRGFNDVDGKFDLNHDKGRIWVGESFCTLNSLKVF